MADAGAERDPERGGTKHVFVTGGVVSSLGKGLTAASLGNLLTSRGLRVVMQKLDPYLNVDPGTMNPFQHGEVFVTDDGAETDLDIGHYERFLDINLGQSANVTTGQIYSQVIARERRGEYLGDTVQVIPHITDEIKRRMRLQAAGDPAPDVIITEIGGTVGDIESQPFLESARQVRHELGRRNVFFVHVSLVPYMGASGEQKTKPTQHSVAQLRSIGIQPDALVLRSDRPVSEGNKRKIALMCDVDEGAVVNATDAESIYDIPGMLHDQGLDDTIVEALGLEAGPVDWSRWSQVVEAVHDPRHEVTIGLVGKYIDLPDAYLSVTEALRAGGKNTREVASRLRREGVLLGVLPPGARAYVYPAFQIDPVAGRLRPVVATVNTTLGAANDPWGVASWWVSPDDSLDEGRAPMHLVGTDVEDDLLVLVGALPPSAASDARAVAALAPA